MNDDNIFSPGGDHASLSPSSAARTSSPVDLQVLFLRTFDLMFENIGTLMPVIAVLFMLSLVSIGGGMAVGIWGAIDPENNQMVANVISYLLSFVIFVIQLFFQMGLIRMILALDRGEEAGTEMMFEQATSYPRALVVMIGMVVAVLVGYLFCIVPGVYLAFALCFVLVIVVDTDLAIPDVFGASWEITEGYRGFLFLQAIVLGLLSFAAYCITCGLAAPFASVFYIALQVVTYNAIRAAKAV